MDERGRASYHMVCKAGERKYVPKTARGLAGLPRARGAYRSRLGSARGRDTKVPLETAGADIEEEREKKRSPVRKKRSP
jgi:hypothetical protein